MSMILENTLRPDQFQATLTDIPVTSVEVPQKKIPWGWIISIGLLAIGFMALILFYEQKLKERAEEGNNEAVLLGFA